MTKSPTRSILRAGLLGGLLGVWSSFCVLISAYLIYPHVDAIFGWKVDSFHHLIWGIFDYCLVWPLSSPFVAFTAWILLSSLFVALLAFIVYKLKLDFEGNARKSLAWAAKSLLNHYVFLLIYIAIFIYLILQKPNDTIQAYVFFLGQILGLFLPFVFLQPKLFAPGDSNRVIRLPSWPGLSPFLICTLLLMIEIILGFFGDLFFDALEYTATAFLLLAGVSVIFSGTSLIQVWAFLTRSGFRRTLNALPLLFSKKVLGGWMALCLYFLGIEAFASVPIILGNILNIFYYPVIVESSRTSGAIIELPWFLIHRLCENSLHLLYFVVIPLEMLFLLSAGRYLWQWDIGKG
jgi:hypothetical protein